MVRVLGNDAAWIAAYGSPIYFDAVPRARQPAGFTSLVNGRVYSAGNNAAVQASVACIRDGKTLWTMQTNPNGLFRAYVPLDAKLVATDATGRQITRDFLNDEQVYKFCHELHDNFPNLTGSIPALRSLLQEVSWEFPLGYKNAASYVRQSLSGNGPMSDFAIQSAPPPTPGKTTTEITTLLVDKTRAQAGDTIHYAVIFRSAGGGLPSEELSVEWKGWDPAYPRLYTKHGKVFHHNNAANTLISLGRGFYVRQGSVVVPTWVGNINSTSPGLRMAVTVRGAVQEEANLLIAVGPTRPQVLVSSTSDGFPATWGEFGIGPCYFHRQLTANVRYSDYRRLKFSLRVNEQVISVEPLADTRHASDADDALFEDYFYYDGQLGSNYQNIPARDEVRTQPPVADFSRIAIGNPQDRSGQNVNNSGNTLALPIPESALRPGAENENIIYWQHTSGRTASTHLSGTAFTTEHFLRGGYQASRSWLARTVSDMNGDGSADIVWQSASGGSSVWFMQGSEFRSALNLRNGLLMGPAWTLSGSGDVNADGHADLIWRHSTGRMLAWTMNGAAFKKATPLAGGMAVEPTTLIIGAPDLDRNGSGDLLLHHANGKLNSWLLDRTAIKASASLNSFGRLWRMAGFADFDRDGSTDLIWQHQNGIIAIWFMNGKRVRNSVLLMDRNPAREGWRIIGAE